MKKLLFPVLIIAAGLAFYEQTRPKPDVWITVIAVVVFMFGMMWLSSKTPSKNQEKDGDGI